jgi:RNA polymerase primary sigma factor
MSVIDRAEALRAQTIDFIGNEEFVALSTGGETTEELREAVSPRFTAPPKDLPAHLARLCEVDLLTAEEERAMFRSMNYLKFRAHTLINELDADQPDEDAVREAERALQAAQQVRDELIQANMRLAISVVKKFVSPQRSFDDMLSDGIFSLMQAVDKFDYDRGFRFSTYAYRAIARNAYRKMQDGQKEAVRLVNSEDEVYEIEDQGSTSSLDERTWELLRGTLSGLMDRLDRREQFILRGRYALGSHRKVKTFQSLADKLGLSKERVRQLEQRAVAKLRRWSTELQVLG